MAMLLGKLIPKICYGALFGIGTFRRMTVSDVASEMLVSERTVKRYVERFQQTGSVPPRVKKNGTDRMLSEFDEAAARELLT